MNEIKSIFVENESSFFHCDRQNNTWSSNSARNNTFILKKKKIVHKVLQLSNTSRTILAILRKKSFQCRPATFFLIHHHQTVLSYFSVQKGNAKGQKKKKKVEHAAQRNTIVASVRLTGLTQGIEKLQHKIDSD